MHGEKCLSIIYKSATCRENDTEEVCTRSLEEVKKKDIYYHPTKQMKKRYEKGLVFLFVISQIELRILRLIIVILITLRMQCTEFVTLHLLAKIRADGGHTSAAISKND